MNDKQETDEQGKSDQERVVMFAVWVMGCGPLPVATFGTEELAEEWGRDNFRGNWYCRKIEVELPFFSEDPDAMQQAKEHAKKWNKLFRT